MKTDMLDITKHELDKHDALTPGLNPHTQRIVNAIVYPTVDPRMKAVIATSQIIAFASQFRRNIILWDDASIPINSISFVITGSGGGKDSSVKAARKCFSAGYKMIDSERKLIAKKRAIEAAAANGEDSADDFEIYKSYLQPIPPVDITPTTGPGLIQHINDIGDLDLSAGYMYSGEFSDELAHNPDMMEDIKILSEVYDTGDKEVKYTKGVEHRSRAIVSQPVSALFVGSPGHILYDDSTKKKFDVSFMSKLARRSDLCYTPESIPEPVFDSLDEMLEYEERIETTAKQARNAMEDSIKDITTFGIKTAGNDITVATEVSRLFKTYKRYNADLANTMPNQASTSVLIRRHLQWKAIKHAAALALLDKCNQIELRHYVDAIKFCELLSSDMELFEHDLNKSEHERFSDYIRTELNADGRATLDVHTIKKQGFISTTSKSKLQELVTLCAAYDRNGIYEITNEGGAIQYEPIIKTEVIGISFKPIDNSTLNKAVASGDSDAIRDAKHDISLTTAHGYTVNDTTFQDLSVLLEGDYAYSPFKFDKGVRGRDNIIGGTKWVVLDIDDSPITASEAHFMISDINHHIALSSDPDNEFKFRVLIELDSLVELDGITWKYFYTAIAHNLALKVDHLPQSQIFFSYADRPILSVTDASPLEARNYIMDAKEKAHNTPVAKPITAPQKQALLSDPLETFAYCFEAPNGAGSRSMIRLAYHARDLGCSLDDTIQLLNDVQDYWTAPMESSRFELLTDQVRRMF